jgi:hypothetical protein
MKIQLPDGICSPQDLRAVILEIRDYARWSSHAAVKKQVSGKAAGDKPETTPEAAAIVKAWTDNKPLTQAGLDELIAELEDFEAEAPYLTITLAAAPSGGFKKELAAWCRQNIEPNVLVSFKFNSTLLGGLVVRYGSRIYDWSFRRQLLTNRAKFPEVLRRV